MVTAQPPRDESPDAWSTFFRESLAAADEQGVLRKRQIPARLIDFGSNDYLGLRRDSRLIEAVRQQLATMGVGAGASPLVSGFSPQLAELERRLAQWQGAESALVFSSGFAMNIGVVSALVGPHDLILSDQWNHASLIDGCRLSRAHRQIYPHANVEHLTALLRARRANHSKVLVITESVFSMDGDVAPLAALGEACRQYEAALVVDEAHATGVFGASGAGLVEELGDDARPLAKLGTLSKGIGTCGGFVTGRAEMIEFLINRCRSYIYSTAIAPPVVAATQAAVELIINADDRRQRLQTVSQRVRSSLNAQGWRIPPGRTPIVPVIVGDSIAAQQLSSRLAETGFYVPAIRPPTVPPHTARLRISLNANHSDEEITGLIQAFGRAG